VSVIYPANGTNGGPPDIIAVDQPVRATALAANAAGLCVLPPKQDGSKAPDAITWTEYQARRPSLDEIERWYSNGRTGVGLVCGSISGNLEVLDFDQHGLYEAFKQASDEAGLADVIERIEAGYYEQSPAGDHLPYRCEAVSGNTKLAKRPKRPDEMRDANDKEKTLIETRGQGGYIIVAPTHGAVNLDGSYRLVRGGLETIATITPEEREALHDLARTFDQMPRTEVRGPILRRATESPGEWEIRPGDDYNQRTSWPDVLEPHGWRFVKSKGETDYWAKPGKQHRGWSATTNHDGSDLLYVFSTSTQFDADRAYSRFAVYTILNHGGSFTEAAKALADRGYGKRATLAGTVDAPAPVFPLEALPPTFRVLVEEGAASLAAPPDYIAVPLLVLAGATLGGAMEVEIKPGWREGPNLYAAIIGDPGSKKSPALDQATRPVYRLQRELKRTYDDEYARYETDLAIWEATPKKDRTGTPKPKPPVFPHIVTTDATTEALAVMLQSAKGLVLTKDELVGWVKSMDQYRGGRGADRQHFLSFWSRQTVKVDRKGASPIIVSRPCLSVCGGIQPELLSDLADAAQRDDGFLDRLLWSFPDPVPDRWTDEGIRLEPIQAVERTFQRLYRTQPRIDDDGDEGPRVVVLSGAARELWQQWYAEWVKEKEAPAFPRRLRGPWAKLPAHLARVALILHALREPDADELSDTTLAAAADVIDYFKLHAQRVYAHLGQQRRDLVTSILAALKKQGRMKQSEFLHAVFKRNVPADRIREALEQLEASGLTKREVEHAPGEPSTTWWSLA
jgi:hypothetical protein